MNHREFSCQEHNPQDREGMQAVADGCRGLRSQAFPDIPSGLHCYSVFSKTLSPLSVHYTSPHPYIGHLIEGTPHLCGGYITGLHAHLWNAQKWGACRSRELGWLKRHPKYSTVPFSSTLYLCLQMARKDREQCLWARCNTASCPTAVEQGSRQQ